MKLYIKLTGKRVKKDWESLSETIVFSIFSYFAYGLFCYLVFKLKRFSITNISAFYNEEIEINWDETIWATIISIIIAIILCYINTYGLINKFAQMIKATKKYGDEDVWNYFHNANMFSWVVVRDHKLKLIYTGYIKVFSDSGLNKELVIEDVEVFSAESKTLYKTEIMYICRKADEITIEIDKKMNKN